MPAGGVSCCCSLRTAFLTDRMNELTRGALRKGCWQNERVDMRCTEEGLLVVCYFFFCQLRLPNCLETVNLLLFYYKLFRHNGKGSPRQQHFKAIFRRGWRGCMAKKGQASGQTSACRWRHQLSVIVPGRGCSGSIWKWRRRTRRTSTWSRPGLRKYLRTARSQHTEN